MSRPLLVGLTGGLASGKSTVAGWLGELGCTVLDADRLVAELYRPGAEGAQAVERLFGPEVLTADGAVDRPKVAQRVFADDDARRRLEQAIHPLVAQRFVHHTEEAEGILIYEATLLVEAGRADEFDLVVTVEADADRRLRWAVERGLDEESARGRLRAQGDGTQRRGRADRILQNDGSLDDLRHEVEKLLAELEAWHASFHAAEDGPLAGVFLVTGNPNKLAEARRLVGEGLRGLALDLQEIQSLDLAEILEVKGDGAAAAKPGASVIVEDVSLELDALGGFPGPLVKWMLQAVGPEGIARTVHALGNPAATARCALLLDTGTRRVRAEGVARGRILKAPRGDEGFGWDPIFLPDGEERTYAELPPRRKDAIAHRGLAWRALVARLAATAAPDKAPPDR
ncbi:MAG: dephospho-CoA kinase [Acidobacteriota bacterium]|nr:dephospho-CoA kinase [Acidobacteriota bacterium]